jgi:endonuclease/exonuclease/phosphatase family metal-dependent hydrolase
MQVKIGTFNLNNLFSRYNFSATIEAGSETAVSFTFTDPDAFAVRMFNDRLVKPKSDKDRQTIANRILSMDVDVLAVQEVEDIVTLRRFNEENLGGLYPFQVLIEGNDDRLIDVALLSRLPVGPITSWQTAVHPDDPDNRVFGRDLLEVEILTPNRKRKLFSLFNNHLKSHFVPFNQDPVIGARLANEWRQRQAEMVATIVKKRTRPTSAYVILGDMNDPPDSPWLAPLTADTELNLTNALANPVETRPAKKDKFPPTSPAWTHRFKPSGRPTEYQLYDQIWLSPSLARKQTGAWIDRRTKHGGNGSDHDPAWITLNL